RKHGGQGRYGADCSGGRRTGVASAGGPPPKLSAVSLTTTGDVASDAVAKARRSASSGVSVSGRKSSRCSQIQLATVFAVAFARSGWPLVVTTTWTPTVAVSVNGIPW